MSEERRRAGDLIIDDLRVRVTDVEKTFNEVRNLIAMRNQRNDDMYEKVDTIYSAIVGNIEKAEPGLLTKVDRLEQSEENKKFIWLGIFGLAMNAAWEWLKKH